jgi:hypothetical protein
VRGWLGRRGWLVAIAAAYLYVFPYFPAIHSANELPRVYLVQAIAEEGSLAIDRGVARWGGTADVSPSGGHYYSNKAPGSSLLVAPVYAAVRAVAGELTLGQAVWLCRVVAGVLPMLLLLALLDRFLARWAEAPARRLVLVGYALGSLALPSSILFLAHQLAASCLAAAWIFALDVAAGRRGAAAAAVSGGLAGAAVLVEYQAAFVVPVVAAHAAWALRGRPWRDRARLAGAAALAGAVPLAALLAYHAVCFGSPLRTGYAASTTFAAYHQQGLLGITALRWEALVGSTVAPDHGLIALAPWWLLAIPGSALLWRAGARDVALAGAAVATALLLFVSSINFWRGGWCVGPRYITAMLPFLLPAVTAAVAAVARRPGAWRAALAGAAAGAIAIGVAIYCIAAATFPHWPDRYRAPLYEVSLRLLGEGLAAPSVGTALGLSPGLSAAIYLAGVGALLAWAIGRAAGARAVAVAAGVALAGLAAHAAAPRTPGGDAPYERVVRAAVASAPTVAPR